MFEQDLEYLDKRCTILRAFAALANNLAKAA
jgi:hypothetical protein